MLLLLKWTHIPRSQLSLGIREIPLFIPDFSSWRIKDNNAEEKEEMKNEEKSVGDPCPTFHGLVWGTG